MTINVFGRDIWFCIRPNLGLFWSLFGLFCQVLRSLKSLSFAII